VGEIHHSTAFSTAGLRRALHDINLRLDLYTHFYKNEFPTHFHPVMEPDAEAPESESSLSLTLASFSTRPCNGFPHAESLRKRPSVPELTRDLF